MTPKLEIAVLAGAESKAWLVSFTKQVDRLEKIMGGKKVAATEDVEETEVEETEDDDDFAPAPKAKAAAAKKTATTTFDEDDEVVETHEDDEDEAPVKKTAKAKKLTVDDVNDACKAYARENGGGKEGREAVLKILKKHFKTTSVSTLEATDYAKAIKLLGV